MSHKDEKKYRKSDHEKGRRRRGWNKDKCDDKVEEDHDRLKDEYEKRQKAAEDEYKKESDEKRRQVWNKKDGDREAAHTKDIKKLCEDAKANDGDDEIPCVDDTPEPKDCDSDSNIDIPIPPKPKAKAKKKKKKKAKKKKGCLIWIVIGAGIIWGSAVIADGATVRSKNFVVTARTADLATRALKVAQFERHKQAMIWLGKPLPDWVGPCSVTVNVGGGAGGSTTFAVDRGHVYGWNMNVQGPEKLILESVIPHEVTHTVVWSAVRKNMPRWADEGAATLAECDSEKARILSVLDQAIKTKRLLPIRRMLSETNYPRGDMVLMLYAQGYSITKFLVDQSSEPHFLSFIEHSKTAGWDAALREHYKIASVEELEFLWMKSVATKTVRKLPAGAAQVYTITARGPKRHTRRTPMVRAVKTPKIWMISSPG